MALVTSAAEPGSVVTRALIQCARDVDIAAALGP